MEKKKGRVPASPERPDSAPPSAPREASAAAPSLPWTLTWFVLALLFLTLVWYPASKLSAHYSFGSNEGFNTTFAAEAAAGVPIYGNRPVYSYANYPPVSFDRVAVGLHARHQPNRPLDFFFRLSGNRRADRIDRGAAQPVLAVRGVLGPLLADLDSGFRRGPRRFERPPSSGCGFQRGGTLLLSARPRIHALAVYFPRRVCGEPRSEKGAGTRGC